VTIGHLRWDDPHEYTIANAALFLCSSEAEMITGINLRVDAGLGA
jgi:NAD(P)-dependent dehydrogenase (short-subunit alcohol dehydrogenase family)